jgi:hypothetical protein
MVVKPWYVKKLVKISYVKKTPLVRQKNPRASFVSRTSVRAGLHRRIGILGWRRG